MTKDEALKKCLRVLYPIAEQRMYEAQWVDSAIKACQEALEQPKEPKYLYVHIHPQNSSLVLTEYDDNYGDYYVGKIKLEADHDF